MNFNRKSIVAAAVAMALGTAAQADVISFDVNGSGAGGALTNVGAFDWAPGTAAAIGAVPLAFVGQTFTLLYQANLSVIKDAGNGILATNGLGGAQFFTAVAGFNEVVTGLSPSGATFGLSGGGSFFRICAHSSAGIDLTGAGFACSTPILTGHIATVNSSNFSIASTTGVTLDQSPNGNQWGSQLSVTGSGASDIDVKVDSVDTNYFTDINTVKEIVFSFFNSSQVTPFKEVDPSRCMSTNGITDCNHTNVLGAVNGLFTSGPDFIFQADANQSFVRQPIPEPGTIALLGAALGVAGFIGRRRVKKAS